MSEKYKYYQSVTGAVVQRYGQQSFIGVRRSGNQHQWSDKIVRLPIVEYMRYMREYSRAVRDGSLIELKESDYVAQQKQFEANETKPKTVKKKTVKKEG